VNKKRYPLKTLIGAPYRSIWEAPRNGRDFLPLKEKPRIQDISDVNPTGVLHHSPYVRACAVCRVRWCACACVRVRVRV
jgi:hypothetical protein